jgi:hypothetical protein
MYLQKYIKYKRKYIKLKGGVYPDDTQQLSQTTLEMECYDYEGRIIISTKLPNWIQSLTGVTTQAFYRSTGTSNIHSFPDTYFPFFGINIDGGLIKGWSSSLDMFGSSAFCWREKLCNQMSVFGFDEYIKSEGLLTHYQPIASGSTKWRTHSVEKYCDKFMPFLSKFTDWWEVRVSASIGGGIWDNIKYKNLLDLTKKYEWLPPTIYIPPSSKDFSTIEKYIDKLEKLKPLPPPIDGSFEESQMINILNKTSNCVKVDKQFINDWLTRIDSRHNTETEIHELNMHITFSDEI